MKAAANPVTPEDKTRFIGFIEAWQRKLNLLDWRMVCGNKPAKGAMADVDTELISRMATYRIGDNFGSDEVNAYSLESTACHELLHVLVAEYRGLIEGKADDFTVDSAEHRIIHTLERLLVPKP